MGTDNKAEKRSSAIFLLKMKETHFLSQAAIDDIVHGYRDLLDHSLVRLKSHVRERLSQSETNGDNADFLNDIYADFKDPFDELETCYKQEKYFKEELGLVVSLCLFTLKCIHQCHYDSLSICLGAKTNILYSYFFRK